MIKAILTLAINDLLQWRRSVFMLISALIPPIGMTAMLTILSLTVLQQPVALVIESHGPQTSKMANIIQADTDAYILTVTDKKHAEYLLKSQLVAAVITIPSDFEDQATVYRGEVHYTLNNIDIDFADDIRRSIDRSVAQFDAPNLALGEEEGEGTNATQELREVEHEIQTNPYRIDVRPHSLRQTNVEWLQYQVLPALILLVLNVALMGTALLCSLDNDRQTAKYLAISPHATLTIIIGRLLGGFIAATLALIPALIACVYTGLINPPANHWPALIAIFAATAFCAAGMGACIGNSIRGTRTVAMLGSIISIYLFFLGGGFTTIEFLPSWLQEISKIDPMRYAIAGMRQALFYNTLDGVTFDIIVLVGTGIIMLGIGALTFRRTIR